jgi:hypothetical protein
VTIKISRLGSFQINEETTNPRGEMFLEELLLHPNGYRELTADHPGHDLAKSGCVILWFRQSFGAFNAVRAKILAQSRQWPFVEKAGEIV